MYPQISNLINSNKKQTLIIQPNNPTQLGQVPHSNSKQLNSSNQQINATASKNLALNMMMKREGDRLETKSSREFIGRGQKLSDSNVRNEGKTVGGYAGNMNIKTNFDREDDD